MSRTDCYLTDSLWERRIRRTLSKYGYILHKSRKRNGGYTVVSIHDEDDSAWYPTLDKLEAAVEFLVERYAE